MAKKTVVTIKGVGEAQKNAIKFLTDYNKDKKLLDKLGSEIVLQIQRRTTAGLDEYKQDPLTESTIVSRELLADINSLNQFAKPKRSNLTLSGQLLSSIKNKANVSTATIVIFLKDFRYKYLPPTRESITRVAAKKPKSKRGFYHAIGNIIMSDPPKDTTNNKVRNDLEKQGRKFMFMSDKIQIQLEKNLTRELSKALTLYNKVKRTLKL